MKLIDIETGTEYTLSRFKAPYIIATGKTYEKREGYSNFDGGAFTPVEFKGIDTHRAICFLEPLKKVVPMPEILPGDLIVDSEFREVLFTGVCLNLPSIKVKEMWRNGVKIWERKP